MLACPLPSNAVGQLEAWRAAAGACYAEGTGAHAVHYVPALWAGIRPWPGFLADQTQRNETALSRQQVREVAHACTRTSGWADALVASYVWGQGRNGYGPHRLRRILERASARTVLSQAAENARGRGRRSRLPHPVRSDPLLGAGVPHQISCTSPARCCRTCPLHSPLILDQRIARVLRAYVTLIGQETGLEEPARLAKLLWSDDGWTPHRYDIYLK
ncbi:hypothetical protein [Streptomyces sp. BV129]|uniref:8-oxoguanine DNA glycosylase OGG fold protein n=1 Tax=Streptomyces sp. BV129 TaxID=2849671 RepID=UPI0035AC0114